MIWLELLIFDVDDTPLSGLKCITSILATLTLNGGEFQNDGTITLRAAIGPGNSLISAYICVGQRERLFRGLAFPRSEEHTSELQSHLNLVCRLLLEKKKKKVQNFRETS